MDKQALNNQLAHAKEELSKTNKMILGGIVLFIAGLLYLWFRMSIYSSLSIWKSILNWGMILGGAGGFIYGLANISANRKKVIDLENELKRME